MGKYASRFTGKATLRRRAPGSPSTTSHISVEKDSLKVFLAAVNSDELYRLISRVYHPSTYRLRIEDH
jgi:hypothetical protein